MTWLLLKSGLWQSVLIDKECDFLVVVCTRTGKVTDKLIVCCMPLETTASPNFEIQCVHRITNGLNVVWYYLCFGLSSHVTLECRCDYCEVVCGDLFARVGWLGSNKKSTRGFTGTLFLSHFWRVCTSFICISNTVFNVYNPFVHPSTRPIVRPSISLSIYPFSITLNIFRIVWRWNRSQLTLDERLRPGLVASTHTAHLEANKLYTHIQAISEWAQYPLLQYN